MLLDKTSRNFQHRRGNKPRQQQAVLPLLPQNVQLDIEPATFMEFLQTVDNDESSDSRPHPKQRDYKIVGFTELFRLEVLARLVKCSGANCKIKLSSRSYAFCENFHLFCSRCVQNLSFCWVKDTNERLCQQSFFTAEIPLYSNFLADYTFVCPNVERGCDFTGRPEALVKHFSNCNINSGFQFPCHITGCKSGSETFQEMVAHLKERHHSIFVERNVTAVSLRIPWMPKTVDCYTWTPAIFKTRDVYILITLRLQYGTLYQWIYVEDERRRDDKGEIFILSGFEIAGREITLLKVDPPQNLTSPVSKIMDDQDCFAMDFEDFFEEHLMLDGQKQIRYFIFDLDIALL